MSTQLLDALHSLDTTPSPAAARAPSAKVTRSAFYLTSRSEPLAAWLHTAGDRAALDHGVVICPSIGFEQLHANRSLRHLADAIAAQGIPTLRFDWHGTGDSAGSDADPSRRATWQANVRDAIAWLRDTLGCRKISVVGQRLGAMLVVEALAADSSTPIECDNLVLWAPTHCGKTFMRQMQTIEQLAEARPRPKNAAAGDIEAAGFLLSEETANQLTKCSLLQKELSCSRALVVGPFDKRLVERFAQFEIPVEQISLPGYAEMMAEPHFSQVPRETVTQIAAWLGTQVRNAGPNELVSDKISASMMDAAKFGPQQTLIAGLAALGDEAPAWGNVRERLLRFGGTVDLFGIVCEPEQPIASRPTIVLLNSGAANHVGPGRLYVELARRLARHGFRTLRLDACGLGDSVTSDPAAENNPYPPTVFRDVELALAELRTRFGTEQEPAKFVLMGLCSGAYAAFQAAAQLSDPSIVESVLINPLTFYWQDGMPFDASGAEKLLEEHKKMAVASNPKKILQFLCGKTEIGYGAALKLLVKRIMHKLAKPKKSPANDGPTVATTPLGHPKSNDLPADLTRIAAHGRSLAMILAENDPGLAVMSYHAARETKAWLKRGDLRLLKISGGDHTFSRRVPREVLIRTVAKYLTDRFAVESQK